MESDVPTTHRSLVVVPEPQQLVIVESRQGRFAKKRPLHSPEELV
jgi:hypothetical protein